MRLSDLQIGARLIYRAKNDWRTAAIAKKTDEFCTLTVCSPTGRCYRVKRDLAARVYSDGAIAVLIDRTKESWREAFSIYDKRW
ncbi:MAG: hypothetical protein ACK5NT_01035 [Pyrinomonadaceae bacterium]